MEQGHLFTRSQDATKFEAEDNVHRGVQLQRAEQCCQN